MLVLAFMLFFITVLNANTTRVNPDEYIIKAGDVFFIQALTADTLTVKSPVLPAGSLSLFPFSDSVMVAGNTLTEAYQKINKKIGNYIAHDKILIQLGIISPTRFHVMGAVVRPGEHISEELVSLQQALNLSGGMASSASKKISILRNKQLLKFDLNEYYANNDIKSNPLIMHDDVILVNLAQSFVKVFTNNDTINYVESVELKENKSKISDVLRQLSLKHQWSNLEIFTVDRKGEYLMVDRTFELEPFDRLFVPVEELYVYVNGHVTRPGRFPYNGSLNANYYLSQSGGPSPNGARNKLFLVREHGKKELYTGQPIKPGDTLFVPESLRSMIVSYLVPTSTVISLISTIVIINNNLK